jgi:uncharacterized protein HemX
MVSDPYRRYSRGMSSPVVQRRPNYFGSGTVRVALLGYVLGGVAILLSLTVFTDETQTNAVVWLRIGALGLGVAAAGFFVGTTLNWQREQKLLRRIEERRNEEKADVDLEQLRAMLHELQQQSAVFKYEAETVANREDELLERVRALQEENEALISLLNQKRTTEDG